MPFMILEITDVAINQRPVSLHHQQVFRVLLFCRLGKIEGTGNQGAAVDNDNLVVGNGVCRVDIGRNARMGDKICRGVLCFTLTSIQNGLDPDPALSCLDEGLCDRYTGKRVGLQQDLSMG
jgi:hypothetical protein